MHICLARQNAIWKKNQKKSRRGKNEKKKNQESVGEPQRVSGIPARWQFISTIHPQPVLLPFSPLGTLSVGAQQTHYLEIQYSTDFARLRGPFFFPDFFCFFFFVYLLPVGRAGTQV